jgi:hypothetical protein
MDSETVDEKIRSEIRHALYDHPQADLLERLRDEFAMAALTGLLANGTLSLCDSRQLFLMSFQIADAMMEARKK